MLYIYPAIVYDRTEDEPFVIVVPDVNIVAEGDTLEDAVIDAKGQLKIYVQCVGKFNANLPKPTSFEEFREKYPKRPFLFIDTVVEEGDDDITVIF